MKAQSNIIVHAYPVQGEIYFRAQDVIDWLQGQERAVNRSRPDAAKVIREMITIFTKWRRDFESRASR